MVAMDPQAFARKDQADFFEYWKEQVQSPPPEPQLHHYTNFSQFSNPDRIDVTQGSVTDSNVVDWAKGGFDPKADSSARVLLALFETSKHGAPHFPPFSPSTFQELVEILGLHLGALAVSSYARASKCESSDGVTAFYIETINNTRYWFKLHIAFDRLSRKTTTIVQSNCAEELESIQAALDDPVFHPLAIHPLFVPTLILARLFRRILRSSRYLFTEAKRIYYAAPFVTRAGKEHLKQNDMNIEKESEALLACEQDAILQLEKVDFGLKLGTKLKTWLDYLSSEKLASEQKCNLQAAGTIIRGRVEDLVDGLETQNVEVKEAQGLLQINRIGLEVRNATLGNKLSARISEQSRDIARESKRDSSAMKAIAVLTMFFLPGTFFAAFFAMPLFDWGSSSSAGGHKLWIYWATTVPATILVLVVWRVWYVFDEWRQTNGANSTHKDLFSWVKARGAKKHRNPDIEKGEDFTSIGL